MPAEAATWEDFYVVRSRFPSSVAWGQATSAAGGDVRHGDEAKAGTQDDAIDVSK